MQFIQPLNHENKTEKQFRRNLLLTVGLGAGGLIVLLLPAVLGQTGFIFWVLSIGGLICLGAACIIGRQVWLYLDEQRVQKMVIAKLAQSLDDDFKYLRNLTPSSRTLAANEIGGVLIGPHGALVLQICNYRGIYACEGDTWYKYNRQEAAKAELEPDKFWAQRKLDDSPNWRVIRAAREVKAWLSVRELPSIPVQPVVVMARGRMRTAKRPSCPIVELWYLETYIKSTLSAAVPAETENEPVSDNVVNQIVERLQS